MSVKSLSLASCNFIRNSGRFLAPDNSLTPHSTGNVGNISNFFGDWHYCIFLQFFYLVVAIFILPVD